MKIYTFKDLENLEKDIADKSAGLDKQRDLIRIERIQLKRAWIERITSPSALLLSVSLGFMAGYFRKSKPKEEAVRVRQERLSKARAGVQAAVVGYIKRFISGVVIGIISSISSRSGGPLSVLAQEE